MPSDTSEATSIPGPSHDREFLYSVLNLPTIASEYEIRDRYRQLSVLYHPDKQHDEQTKETAAKRFLEVQKAYQVLSDPVTRRAYDLLGPQGLEALSATATNGLSQSEIENAVVKADLELERRRAENLIRSKGRIAAGIDATSLFEDIDYFYGRRIPWYQQLATRLQGIEQQSFSVRHSVQRNINEKTLLILTGRASIYDEIWRYLHGTIRHQFSPRLNFEATTSLLRSSTLAVKSVWRDDDSTVLFQLFCSRAAFRSFMQRKIPVPPLTVAYSRRLFRNSPTEGTLMFSSNSAVPILSVTVSSAHMFDHTPEAAIPILPSGSDPVMRPPSRSGLAVGASFWNVSTTLAGPMTGLSGEWGVDFAELGVQLKIMLQLGITGWSWMVGSEWRRQDNSVGTSVGLGAQGVVFRLDLAYLGQQLSLPITLSYQRDPALALWTAVLPSTALVLTYQFILKPRRRRQRSEFFRKARRELHEQNSEVLRETKETILLLQDTAKRHMQAEAACEGLIILEAAYGPSEQDESTQGLDMDVTVPVQALVNRSQLYIPGRRSKAGLQGFYDPVAAAAKTLRVRYTFRGRLHYAEFADYAPVVLPLEGPGDDLASQIPSILSRSIGIQSKTAIP
ncbi:DnaJ-domain-containing protein [Amylocystis lapponica]|nr:DnaJ-domain-containing protein [Amylocystis lapponica]